MNDDDDLSEQRDENSDAQPSAADPKRNRKLKVDGKLLERESRRFWAEVFASPIGRREMWAILQQCRAFETPFGVAPNGAPQPEATQWHNGRRDLGLQLYRTWLARDPLAVAQMHAEHDDEFKKFHTPEGPV